ncbi:MAG TPA: hypothetical protein VGE39_06925 [Prosthecobacter sp.]
MSEPAATITREMILGARITDVWCVSSTQEDLVFAECYFTCDRGFSFCLPCGGAEWNVASLPPGAEKFADVVTTQAFGFGPSFLGLFGLQRRRVMLDDRIQKLKQATISRVLCGPLDPELGFFDPFETILMLSDGFCISSLPVSPRGTGSAGVAYRLEDASRIARMTDFFDIQAES